MGDWDFGSRNSRKGAKGAKDSPGGDFFAADLTYLSIIKKTTNFSPQRHRVHRVFKFFSLSEAASSVSLW